MKLHELEALYENSQRCAELIGLSYDKSVDQGYSRVRHGKGFSFTDQKGRTISDVKIKKQITDLVIPPAWQKVWICPSDKGHILATGIDEKGRKQYIYHPKWRSMRDVLKYYRIIVFAQVLPKIRRVIKADLQRKELDRKKVMAVMLWLLDNTYIRIGNDQYYEANDSVGLTTLTDKHLVVAGSVTTLAFRGKSGKDHQITFDEAVIADIIGDLIKQRGERLFRFKEDGAYKNIESDDLNHYLQEITGEHVSAKDFRTWGGTLMAFNHLLETEAKPASETPKDDKVRVEAVDAAANVLGNTRTVARASYVHPDLLDMYGSKDFPKYYRKAHGQRNVAGLDRKETDLIYFLEEMFEEEFDLLQK